MYNIHDFLRGDISIVIKTIEQYEPTMKWFEQYGLKHHGASLRYYGFATVENVNFSVADRYVTLKDIFNGDNNSVICKTKDKVVTVEELDFDENRLQDPSFMTFVDTREAYMTIIQPNLSGTCVTWSTDGEWLVDDTGTYVAWSYRE